MYLDVNKPLIWTCARKVQTKKIVKSNKSIWRKYSVLNFFPVQKLIFGHFENCKPKFFFVKLIYLISRVFLAWTFFNFLANWYWGYPKPGFWEHNRSATNHDTKTSGKTLMVGRGHISHFNFYETFELSFGKFLHAHVYYYLLAYNMFCNNLSIIRYYIFSTLYFFLQQKWRVLWKYIFNSPNNFYPFLPTLKMKISSWFKNVEKKRVTWKK